MIVEDSQVARDYIQFILESDQGIQVIGAVENGLKAVEFVKRQIPDVIIMDIHMPEMDGFEATRCIMETNPVPIIIVSASYKLNDANKTFKAIEHGAVALIPKPVSPSRPDYEYTEKNILQTVKTMSEVKMVKRFPNLQKKAKTTKIKKIEEGIAKRNIKIIAIGASTGGPLVVKQILSGLPANFSIPIIIVQHIATGFTVGFVEWLNKSSSLNVKIASSGEMIRSGHCYVAPDSYHLKVGQNGMIVLNDDPPVNFLRPSISCLFDSVADAYGENAVGVLLTGMGADGASELRKMKDKGALTFVQNRESSVIFSMPGEAIKLGAADYVLSPFEIVQMLSDIAERSDFGRLQPDGAWENKSVGN